MNSSITGSSVGRAGGGAGGNFDNVTGGVATHGGGNAGTTSNTAGSNGTANTGGGGGGSISTTSSSSNAGKAGNGGAGVVIMKYPADYVATFSAGVTQTTTTDAGFKISVITATSTTSETVTFT